MNAHRKVDQATYLRDLMDNVFGVSTLEQEGIHPAILCPKELPIAVEYVLLTLTERERIILRKRFEERLSLRETGNELGVTPERIRQIEHKAIRKLRHPNRAKFLKNGITGEMEEREKTSYKKGYSKGLIDAQKNLWACAKTQSITVLQMKPQTVDVLQNNHIDTIEKLADKSYFWLKDKIGIPESISVVRKLEMIGCDTWLIEEVMSFVDVAKEIEGTTIGLMPIEELNLSVRLCNCLRSAGVKTVEGLVGWTCEDLLNIRNMGVKSLAELKEKLRPLGIELKG